MKKSFSYMLSAAFIFIICLFGLVCAGSICYSFLKIFGVFNFTSSSLIFDILAIILSGVFLTLLIFTLSSCYTVDETYLKLKLGFWDVTGNKFKIENIIKIVRATNADKLYVNLYVDDTPQIVLINIRPRDYDNFARVLRTINSKILYEEADLN